MDELQGVHGQPLNLQPQNTGAYGNFLGQQITLISSRITNPQMTDKYCCKVTVTCRRRSFHGGCSKWYHYILPTNLDQNHSYFHFLHFLFHQQFCLIHFLPPFQSYSYRPQRRHPLPMTTAIQRSLYPQVLSIQFALHNVARLIL